MDWKKSISQLHSRDPFCQYPVQRTIKPLSKPVEKAIKSGLVCQIICSQCQSCYVGQTTPHLLTRIKEHRQIGIPVGNHFKVCGASLTMDNVKIISSSSKSICNFMTLEALLIRSIKPTFNTKDKYKAVL